MVNFTNMIYKFLFYFPSNLEKKCNVFKNGDHYISAYFIVGYTIAVNIFVLIDIVCMLFAHDFIANDVMNNLMCILGFAMIALSYFYLRHDNRRDKIYNEINRTSTSKKIRYGIYCTLYIVISYGLWYVCSDIICVLRRGYGYTYAENIVGVLNLKYW